MSGRYSARNSSDESEVEDADPARRAIYARAKDPTNRYERRVNARRELSDRRQRGTGRGIKSKIIKAPHANASAVHSPMTVTQHGIELTDSAVLEYKWRSVEFVDNLTVNILCSMSVTKTMLNISAIASIVDYVINLLLFVKSNLKSEYVYEKSISNMKECINTILKYDYADIDRSEPVYAASRTGDVNFNTVYTNLYENMIAIHVKQLRDIARDMTPAGAVDAVYEELYTKLAGDFKRFADAEQGSFEFVNSFVHSFTRTYNDIVSKYKPLCDIQILVRPGMVAGRGKKYFKIRKDEMIDSASSDDEYTNDSIENLLRDSKFMTVAVPAWIRSRTIPRSRAQSRRNDGGDPVPRAPTNLPRRRRRPPIAARRLPSPPSGPARAQNFRLGTSGIQPDLARRSPSPQPGPSGIQPSLARRSPSPQPGPSGIQPSLARRSPSPQPGPSGIQSRLARRSPSPQPNQLIIPPRARRSPSPQPNQLIIPPRARNIMPSNSHRGAVRYMGRGAGRGRKRGRGMKTAPTSVSKMHRRCGESIETTRSSIPSNVPTGSRQRSVSESDTHDIMAAVQVKLPPNVTMTRVRDRARAPDEINVANQFNPIQPVAGPSEIMPVMRTPVAAPPDGPSMPTRSGYDSIAYVNRPGRGKRKVNQPIYQRTPVTTRSRTERILNAVPPPPSPTPQAQDYLQIVDPHKFDDIAAPFNQGANVIGIDPIGPAALAVQNVQAMDPSTNLTEMETPTTRNA